MIKDLRSDTGGPPTTTTTLILGLPALSCAIVATCRPDSTTACATYKCRSAAGLGLGQHCTSQCRESESTGLGDPRRRAEGGLAPDRRHVWSQIAEKRGRQDNSDLDDPAIWADVWGS